jgi:hypothetical protein
MEYAAGCFSIELVDSDLRRFQVLEITEAIAWRASRVDRQLRSEHIGDNDVWIAATALAYGLPVVTNNHKHLGRVKGLRVVGYSSADNEQRIFSLCLNSEDRRGDMERVLYVGLYRSALCFIRQAPALFGGEIIAGQRGSRFPEGGNRRGLLR